MTLNEAMKSGYPFYRKGCSGLFTFENGRVYSEENGKREELRELFVHHIVATNWKIKKPWIKFNIRWPWPNASEVIRPDVIRGERLLITVDEIDE